MMGTGVARGKESLVCKLVIERSRDYYEFIMGKGSDVEKLRSVWERRGCLMCGDWFREKMKKRGERC